MISMKSMNSVNSVVECTFSRLQDVTFILGNQEAFVALKNDGGWHRMVNSGVVYRFFVQLCTVCFMMLDGQKAFCNNVYQIVPASTSFQHSCLVS